MINSTTTFIEFAILTLTISLSGVMAPGPMSAVTVNHGAIHRFAGILVATGHAIVEIPTIIALFYGIRLIAQVGSLTAYISLAGGLVLCILATLTLKGLHHSTSITTHSPIIDGVVLSAFNPYFYIWWLTIGLTLIKKSLRFGMEGLVCFSLLHTACDYIWLIFLSVLSYAGASLLGKKFQSTIGIITVIMLYGFGAYFLYEAVIKIL